jgi:hypothetical protein
MDEKLWSLVDSPKEGSHADQKLEAVQERVKDVEALKKYPVVKDEVAPEVAPRSIHVDYSKAYQTMANALHCATDWTRTHCRDEQSCNLTRAKEACELFPGWAWPSKGPPDATTTYTQLPNALRHRKLVLVGDSLMYYSWKQFTSDLRTNTNRTAFGLKKYGNGVMLCGTVSAQNFSVCHVEAGKSNGLTRFSRDKWGAIDKTSCMKAAKSDLENANLGDALACLSVKGLIVSQDIVLVNAGVHHSMHPETTLRLNVLEVVSWYKGFKPQTSRPCVIWKQTLPQHFQSADGGYLGAANIHNVPEAEFDALMSRPGGCCTAIVPNNSATSNSCQRFNTISDPLVKEAKIPQVNIYKALAAVPFLHNGCKVIGKERLLDCTHWKAGAPEAFINQLLLLAVDRMCPRSSSSSSSSRWGGTEGAVSMLLDGVR